VMKIIAFGDIHMATAKAREIPGIKEADLILLTGDLTNYGGAEETKRVLNDIMTINPNVLAQFGNLDNFSVNDYLEDLGINLHGQAHLYKRQIVIIGAGGSNRTPFHTPSEFSENTLTNIVTTAHRQALNFMQLAEPLHTKKIPLVLISHSPPYNTATDKLYNGRHVGSRAIRRFIEQHQPDLCITGHIHESKGFDTIKNTPIYNPGMLRQRGWVTIHLNQSKLKVTLQ